MIQFHHLRQKGIVLTMKAQFNLLTEPWLLVTDKTGSTQTLSITQILLDSHNISSLSGETPTQDIAILRLLLGIMYAIYTRTPQYAQAQADNYNGAEACIDIWGDMWQNGQFSQQDIQAYLQSQHDKFFLIHPTHPFYQLPSITKGTDLSPSKMIGELVESSNKAHLFPMRSGQHKQTLSFAEAARWLVYMHGFDDAAAKKVNKNAGSMSVGWLGGLGITYLTGNNLFETLMLNFVLVNQLTQKPWLDGKATWELESPRNGERTPITPPVSAQELFTLQSRRISLNHDNDKIIGLTLLGGDQLSNINAFFEPMTKWIYKKSKKNEPESYNPPSNISKDPSRQMWRDMEPLLIKNMTQKPPGVISWLSEVEYDNFDVRHVTINTINIKYGSMMSGIEDLWHDSISINSAILAKLDNDWIQTIIYAINISKKLIYELERLAAKISRASGSYNEKTASDSVKEKAYQSLDIHFRTWLHNLNPKTGKHNESYSNWSIILKKTIDDLGKQIAIEAGTHAFVGKENDSLNTAEAYSWFKYNIAKILQEGG